MSRAKRFVRELDPLRAPLAAYCQRLLWRPAELEDALQETLMLAFRRFEEARESAFRPWIFRIATWTCFGFNRRHGASAEAPPEPVQREAAETLARECTYEEILANPDAFFDAFEEELARACRALTEKERAILLLKSLGGLSCAEIAGVLELPLGTAQGLLGRAQGKMRHALVDFAERRGLSRTRGTP